MTNKMPLKPIYLDYNATTPVDPRVFEAMKPYFCEVFGNPSSVAHSYGWEAKLAIDKAREQVARVIGAPAKDILWTSGATESDNMALIGLLKPYFEAKEPCHFITSAVEHKAILDVAKYLETKGVEVTYLKPTAEGEILAQDVSKAFRPHTRLVSIMAAQNEVGTVNNLREIGQACRNKGILFHTDAAQAFGKTKINVEEMNIDLLSGSGHKVYGPKGIGFLYVREHGKKMNFEPIFYGGAQEFGIRPGTVNVPGIVGMGLAAEIAYAEMAHEYISQTKIRDSFISRILESVDGVVLNGHPKNRLPGNISLSFKGLSSDLFALGLSGLAVSSASACTGGGASHVLLAMGCSLDIARATIRIGFGRFTKPADLDIAYEKILSMVRTNSGML